MKKPKQVNGPFKVQNRKVIINHSPAKWFPRSMQDFMILNLRTKFILQFFMQLFYRNFFFLHNKWLFFSSDISIFFVLTYLSSFNFFNLEHKGKMKTSKISGKYNMQTFAKKLLAVNTYIINHLANKNCRAYFKWP